MCRGPELSCLSPFFVWTPRYLCRGPDLLCRIPYLLFRGSEIIMLGPDLSCGHPDLLCPGLEIIMWEPRLCRDPYLSCRGPEMIIWGPSYYVHIKYLLPFFNHNHIWQVSLQLSCDDTFQMWTYAMAQMCHDKAESWGNNGTKAIGLITPSQV